MHKKNWFWRLAALAPWAVLCAARAACAGEPQAPPASPPAAALWRELTTLDVEAAYALLKDDHPGAAPETGDPRFVAALEAAHARALERAAHVSSHEGYVATLGEMANSMGDGHIRSYANHVPREVRWAGLITARQGHNWVVALDDPRITGAALQGARLVECDGRNAEALARDVLHYMAPVDVPAAEAIAASWLLIDQGNPFLTPPQRCVLERHGQKLTLTLNWQPISRAELLEHHWHRAYGEAGFGVRASGAGYWVGIEQLGPQAQAVIEAVSRQAEQLRSAAYVVVDVRGNGGGNDHYMRELAWALYGKGHVDALLPPENADAGACPDVYRASPANMQAMSAAAQSFRQQGDTNGADDYVQAVRKMQSARAAGKALTGSPTCPAGEPAHAHQGAQNGAPASLMHAKVFILTDVACFSSCLNGVGFFRLLGATQIGRQTSANFHYSEVRDIDLPSGLATFSTQQGLMPSYPARIGPFDPVIPYEGDIADTAALERWVSGLDRSP